MKALVLLVALLAGRLTVAPMAWAQEAAAGVTPTQPRFEIGGTAGAIWFEPTLGMLIAMRGAKRSVVEGGATLTPHFVLTQAQLRLRLPIGPRRGARRSLVVGLTHVSRRTGAPGSGLDPGLGAHAGLDLHMLMPFRDGPDAVPRAVVAIVWHP
jgi:hypothetical protein